MLPLFLRGLLLGFTIAAPVGPIGVLCIRRTLAQGRLVGLVSGLGAASADAFYGAIAGLGLTALSGFLVSQQFWLRLLGGAFLLYLGMRTFLEKPADHAAQPKVTGSGLLGAYSSTLLLTLTNPLTILSFSAIFVGLNLATTNTSSLDAIALVCGVFLGSALWWLTLSTGVSFLRTRFDVRAMRWVNWFSGGIIIIFGGLALWGAFLG